MSLLGWTAYLAPLFINLFSHNNKTVMMSYFRRDTECYKFLELINKMDGQDKKIVLSNILVKYVENIAFSPIRWAQLSKDKQKEKNKIFIESTLENGETLLTYKDLNIYMTSDNTVFARGDDREVETGKRPINLDHLTASQLPFGSFW